MEKAQKSAGEPETFVDYSVTVMLTGVFAALALQRCVSAQEFLTVFTVVISFYFGTQHERSNAA